MSDLILFLQTELDNRDCAGGKETDYVNEARNALEDAQAVEDNFKAAIELLRCCMLILPKSVLKDKIEVFLKRNAL